MPFPSINVGGLERLSCTGHHQACGKYRVKRAGWSLGLGLTSCQTRERQRGRHGERETCRGF